MTRPYPPHHVKNGGLAPRCAAHARCSVARSPRCSAGARPRSSPSWQARTRPGISVPSIHANSAARSRPACGECRYTAACCRSARMPATLAFGRARMICAISSALMRVIADTHSLDKSGLPGPRHAATLLATRSGSTAHAVNGGGDSGGASGAAEADDVAAVSGAVASAADSRGPAPAPAPGAPLLSRGVAPVSPDAGLPALPLAALPMVVYMRSYMIGDLSQGDGRPPNAGRADTVCPRIGSR